MTKECEWCGKTFPESINWKGHWVDTEYMGIQRYYVCSDKCFIESEPHVQHADQDEVDEYRFWEAIIGVIAIIVLIWWLES